jgi:hypothetical protein
MTSITSLGLITPSEGLTEKLGILENSKEIGNSSVAFDNATTVSK